MTERTDTVQTALNKPFSPAVIGQLPRGGKKFDFVPIAEVIARMNAVLGTENWGERDVSVERDASDSDWIIARTTVWAKIDGEISEKVGFGSQKITRKSSDKSILDLGNEYKGAHSDAFKKACTKFGVALHLARDEDAMLQEVHENEVRSRANADPLADEDREGIKETIAGLDEAAKEQLKRQWVREELPNIDSSDFTVEHFKVVGRLTHDG